jgi:hypothetical protein
MEHPDPLSLKIRATLFEIRRKGVAGPFKQGYTQGPLLGITLMTKKYKSKRQLESHTTQRSHRENDEN